MTTHASALRIAGAIVVATAGSAAAQDFSTSHSLADGAVTLRAGEGGASVSGDVRNSLAAVAGDRNAEWLSRVRGGYDYHSDGDSRFWAETIQPLAQSGANTVFWQARLAHAHDDQTLNTGLGYRWLSPNQKLMLGVNAFYDYSFDAGHQRASIGAEAVGPIFTFRANVYQAISDWEQIGAGVREHALDGADASVDAQAPYMPWLRIGARYYQWEGIGGPDAEGLQGTLSADVSDHFQFVGTYAGDEDPEGDYYLGLRIRLAGRDGPTATRNFWSEVPLEGRDLSGNTLDFVERENRIITESQGGAYATGTITVSRSE